MSFAALTHGYLLRSTDKMKIIPLASLGLDWSVIFAQALNLLFVMAIIALPLVLWSWLKKNEGKRNERLDRIERKIDELDGK
jgi:hypothetical protein